MEKLSSIIWVYGRVWVFYFKDIFDKFVWYTLVETEIIKEVKSKDDYTFVHPKF